MKIRFALATLVLFIAGCNSASQNSNPTESSGASQNTPSNSGKITRSPGIPDGVTNEDGLTVPRGFHISLFAEGLENPRRIAIAPGATPKKYDVFVAESKANRIRVLRSQGTKADEKFIFAEGLNQPYGLAFHPSGWLYVGNTDEIIRFPYKTGATQASGKPQFISELTKGGYNQHWTRNLIFSPDNKKLYATVGSSCNTCEEEDPQRSAISVMNPDGTERRLFATGLRNPVGVAWQPGANKLWTVVNERDLLGDDTPPDYLTQVQDGAFYGWPYAYTDIEGNVQPDPQFGRQNSAKVKNTVAATVPVQAHSAALGVTFYPLNLKNAFPSEYSGDAFLAYHGSWNRSEPTGAKIVRVDFENGKPVSVSDFVIGFQKDGGNRSGRPVDVQIAPDGSLLFSDDDGGKIWRVEFGGATG